MLTHMELAAGIETMQLAKSNVQTFISNNCRAPSLQRGKLYIMKEWTIKHHMNSDNPYSVVEFVGCGTEVDGVQVLAEENYKINAMQEGQYYFFKAWDKSNEQFYTYGAYEFERALCICSGAVRVTLYEINGCEYDAKAPAKAPSSNASKPTQRVKRVIATVDEEEEVSVVEDDDSDPDYMLSHAVECHRLSMMPLDKKARQTFC